MEKQVVLGIVRHLLTAGGGALTTSGVLSSSDAAAIVGGLVALAGVLWSAWEKRSR